MNFTGSENRKKEFQIRAVNAEGRSEWSDSWYVLLTSATGDNFRPTIHTRSIYGLAIDENTAGAIGAPLLVTEQDAGDTLTWTLSGANASLFAISSSGQLSAAAPGLDYEASATRTVTVTVSDGTDSDSEDVTVTVNDVHGETGAPVIGGDTTITVAENTPGNIGGAITATDPDGGAITWSLSGTDAGSFAISGGQLSLASGVTLDYETKTSYSITVIATGESKSSSVAVKVNVTDAATEPGKVGGVTMTWNSPGSFLVRWGVPSGTGITGYNLRFREAGTSTVWETSERTDTGTSKVITSLVSPKKYELQVRAVNSTGEGAWSDLAYGVMTSGTLLNNRPVIHTDSVVGLAIAENTAGAVGGPIEYTEHDTGDTITWSVGGTDASSFDISGGQLSLASGVTFDYETKNAYSITVKVSDGTDSDTENVTVTVTNVDELGTVTLSPAMLAVGTKITASLTDPDGSVSVTAWQWYNSPDLDGTFTPISGAVSAFYTPVAGDLAHYLVAQASYADGQGLNKIASVFSDHEVAADNDAPVIVGPDSVTIDVAENTPGNIGSAFTATDADDDTITWSKGGSAELKFNINSAGQLAVKSDAGLDYEVDGASLQFTVIASDGNGGSDSVAVTVQVTDEIEAPGQLNAPMVLADASHTGLTVTWSAPTNTGPPITGYELQYRKTGESAWTAKTLGIVLTATIGGLESGAQYQVQVRAVNADGMSEWSATGLGATSRSLLPGKMDAPTTEYIRSFPGSDGQLKGTIRVTWELPSYLGSPPAYKLELRTRRADFRKPWSWWVREFAADATSTSHSLLFNHTAAFQVRLVNTQGSDPCTMQNRETCAKLRELATGYGPWSDTGYGKAAPPCPDCPNNPPVIITAKTMTIAENTPGNFGPVRPRNNGTIRVNDADYDPITWSVGGEHGDLFNISTAEYGHGQLSVASATGLDYEDTGSIKGTYLRVFFITLTASDGKDSDSYDIYVEVLDRAEAPGQPGAPTVTSVAKSNTGLIVEWDAPTNTGPPITGYELQYKKTSESSWTSKSHTGTGVTAAITGLTANTAYQVQVRASNDEATGEWSASGAGTTVTTSAANQAPVIGGPDSVTMKVAENTPGAFGSAFTATDGDAVDTITWSVGGAAGDKFNISSAGRLSAKSATGLDYEEGVILQLTVIASDGTDSDSVAVTVRVSDVDEAPGAPNAPALQSPGSSDTAMRVWWNVPANTGPPITGYELQYRVSSMPKSPPSGPWSIYKPEGTSTMTTITGLIRGTNWEIRVRAVNAEGTGEWSPSSHAWTSGLTPGG